MQWIREQNAELDEYQVYDNNFKTRDDFLNLIVKTDKDQPHLIASLAESLTAEGSPENESLLELVQEQVELPLEADMLLTAACAWGLWRSPDIATWLKVKEVAYNSWHVEHWLNEAMSAYAKNNPCARKAYVNLATLLFKALEAGELKSGSKRKYEAFERAWSNWQNAEFPLEEIWRELPGSEFINYKEEMRIFGFMCEFAPEELRDLIADSNNPLLVDTALLSSGIGAFSPRFAQWATYVKSAPLAFNQDGSWNGSLLLPLLLVHARNELLDPGRRIPRHGADETEVTSLTNQVTKLIRAVVDILTSREEATAMFARWSIWLMRQVLHERESEFSDIRSHDFVDNALLEAIGTSIQQKQLIERAPEDAAPWEAWCHQCVLSYFAHMGFIDPPAFEKFASQWQLTPESWHEQKGRDLRGRANLHIIRDNIPSLSANLLVYPLASMDGFSASWQQLWDSAYYLREVLEFGSVDAGEKSYSDRADASRLLLLLGCMGLACFEQAAARLDASADHLVEELISLYRSLTSAAMEVLNIDDTINRDKWQSLLQHLALRRVYWDASYTSEHIAAIFTGQETPSIRDFLDCFQSNPGDLIIFLHACMLNELDASKLREELRGASVDLDVCVDTLKRLNGLRDRRYPMDSRAIKAIEPLMG